VFSWQGEGVRFVPDARVYYHRFGYGSLSYVGLSDEKIEAHWLSMSSQITCLQSGRGHYQVESCLCEIPADLVTLLLSAKARHCENGGEDGAGFGRTTGGPTFVMEICVDAAAPRPRSHPARASCAPKDEAEVGKGPLQSAFSRSGVVDGRLGVTVEHKAANRSAIVPMIGNVRRSRSERTTIRRRSDLW
jgi:hypothetical protein